MKKTIGKVISSVLTLVILLTIASSAALSANTASSTPSVWARDSISKANSLGLVPTYLDSLYQRNITRSEFCALAVTLYEKSNGVITQRAPAFTDSGNINVLKMAGLGIVDGVGNNKFDPNGELTREQAAAILARLANALGNRLPEAAPIFADNSSISNWAMADVGKVQKSEIMSGVGGNRFDPKGKYTREQSIATILRIWEIINPKSSNGFVFPYKFSTQDLYGNTVTEVSLGEKELFFVHYWATWCGPCINEMPDLGKIAEKYGDRVGFIALLDDYSTAKAAAIRITEASGVSFTMVDARHSDFQTLLKMVQSGYVPTTILIDSDGKIVGDQIIGAYGSGYGRFIDDALEG